MFVYLNLLCVVFAAAGGGHILCACGLLGCGHRDEFHREASAQHYGACRCRCLVRHSQEWDDLGCVNTQSRFRWWTTTTVLNLRSGIAERRVNHMHCRWINSGAPLIKTSIVTILYLFYAIIQFVIPLHWLFKRKKTHTGVQQLIDNTLPLKYRLNGSCSVGSFA